MKAELQETVYYGRTLIWMLCMVTVAAGCLHMPVERRWDRGGKEKAYVIQQEF